MVDVHFLLPLFFAFVGPACNDAVFRLVARRADESSMMRHLVDKVATNQLQGKWLLKDIVHGGRKKSCAQVEWVWDVKENNVHDKIHGTSRLWIHFDRRTGYKMITLETGTVRSRYYREYYCIYSRDELILIPNDERGTWWFEPFRPLFPCQMNNEGTLVFTRVQRK